MKSKVSYHLSEVKMGKYERKYVSGVRMKYLRKCYARAVRRDERRAVHARLMDA
jgi:hypothetical protein